MSADVAEHRDLKVPVKGPDGQAKGEVTISTEKVDDRVRYRLLKESVVNYLANQRQGTHETKTRGQVAGTGKKPWRQKGTGHARAGSRKSPVWRGGGTVFGPHPRDYSYSINKKQRRLALRSAVFAKLDAGAAVVLDGLSLSAPSTKTLAQVLQKCGAAGQRVLLATGEHDRNAHLSARNIPKVEVLPLSDLNTYAVLSADLVVFTKDAFDKLAAGSLVVAGPGAHEEGGEA